QLQPTAEILINTDSVRLQARSERLNTDASRGRSDTTSSLERSWGAFEWRPSGLPVFDIHAQHNVNTQAGASVALSDDLASAGLRYEWHGLQVRAEERYIRSRDPGLGYDRKTTSHLGELSYSLSTFGGRFTVGTSGAAQLTSVAERALNGGSSSLPVPVSIARAVRTVDDTPNDNRDHPLAPYPLLTDSNLNASAGISLGPDASSFQNVALHLGRSDSVDEIRVVVRDAAGNPILTGGGPVTWDLYTSEDGQLWTPRISRTEWNAPLSHYAVTFDPAAARWFKVVNFGVNIEATFVTEVQAYYHREIAAGDSRTGTQNQYSLSTVIAARPWKRLRFTYTGAYSSFEEELATVAARTTSNLDQIGEIEYDLLRSLTLRERVLLRSSSTFTGFEDSANGFTTFLDWVPTRDLRVSLEVGRESQSLGG